jgi:poly(3-hydroxybutyrate) depolymerase
MSIFTDTSGRLTALNDFGTDPGSLSADIYIPENFPKNGPLVVVLHGSTQSPESYDLGSGWSKLADEYGMALLFPGQRMINNLLGSFNWFETGDSHRGGGPLCQGCCPLLYFSLIFRWAG